MITALNYLISAFCLLGEMCYAWSDSTVDIWETFVEYNSGVLNACTDWYSMVEYVFDPVTRWLFTLA